MGSVAVVVEVIVAVIVEVIVAATALLTVVVAASFILDARVSADALLFLWHIMLSFFFFFFFLQVELVVGTHVFYTLGDLVAAEPNLVAA